MFMDTLNKTLSSVNAWLIFALCLAGLLAIVPETVLDPASHEFIFLIGGIGLWRYGVGFTHFVRGMLFLYLVFPWYRRKALALGDSAAPSRVFLMVTSFRIDAKTTAMVYDSVIREAVNCAYPCTVVASIVEMSDELIIKALWQKINPPERVTLDIVRIPGTGKRDGLAYGFRAISRAMPDDNAIVAVIDGDTVLTPGVVRKTAPYFKLFPNVGALTTNEFCEVKGSHIMSEWHKLRFAQRHVNMCSMSLSHRVLTLTGRMSVFRAKVITQADFIYDVENDALDHWRLGHFKFLTGDDKSSWYSLMRLGWDTFYVPDATIVTVEHPPDPRFMVASRKLMFRWYGNNLRQNSRALNLGVSRLGLFTWYVLLDQRISMWTSLLGPCVAILAAIKYSATYLVIYVLWVGITRSLMTLMLLASGHRIGPLYPLILYYNQIVGSLMKIYVFFRLDQQSWTRQSTKLTRNIGGFQTWLNRWSSVTMTFSAASIFAALVLILV
jgi:glycosyltransferase Alg8